MNPQELKSWLSTGQVSTKYKLARKNVIEMCNNGRMSEDEAVETALGWLIRPEAAERVWGYRITENK